MRQSLVNSLVAAVISLNGFGAQGDEESPFRIWTDVTGKFQIEARFEDFADGKVHLVQKQPSKPLAVPSSKLSKEDRAYVQRVMRERAKSERAGPVRETSAPAGNVQTDSSRTWKGTWNNRKYGTSGPLTCIATTKDGKVWQAKFEGVGIGNPFKYDATFNAQDRGGRTLLQGTSTISGDMYRWTGSIANDTLVGKYRSASGNNGEFRLKEMSDRSAPSTR